MQTATEMLHSATQLADTVINRFCLGRETTVEAGGPVWLRVWVSPYACVSPFLSPRGSVFERVLTVETTMSAHPQMKKFIPLLRHNVVISVAKGCIMSFIKIYTTNKHEEGLMI